MPLRRWFFLSNYFLRLMAFFFFPKEKSKSFLKTPSINALSLVAGVSRGRRDLSLRLGLLLWRQTRGAQAPAGSGSGVAAPRDVGP